MTSSPIWFIRRDGKPVHNGQMYAIREGGDGAPCENYLDPQCTAAGARIRRSNLHGEVCNDGADGRPRGFYLKDVGDYTIYTADQGGSILSEVPWTVAPDGQSITINSAERVSMTPMAVNIHAGQRGVPAVMAAPPPPEPVRLQPLADEPKPVHIREAIRERIKRL